MNQATTWIANGFDRRLVDELVALQQAAFPPRMQFPNAAEYYADGLRDPDNVNVIMQNADGKVIGYLLALPQSRVWEELRRWDPQLEPDPEGLYLDIIQTLPGRRQANGFVNLLSGVCREARRRRISRLSGHVRASNGVSRLTRKVFAENRCLRRIENWFGSGEPFDYIEASPRLNRGDF